MSESLIKKAVDVYRAADEILTLRAENQRLRAALHKITQIYDDPNLHDLTACHEMNRVAKEALSTTIEPTNAAKMKRIECPCCGCEISAKEKVGTDEWRHKYINAYWAREGLIKHQEAEVQRLRAAIKKAISMWHNTCDFADPEDVIKKMIAYLNEALSGAREKEEPNHD